MARYTFLGGSTTLARVRDEELLTNFLGGDQAAFREIVTRYHTTLVRVARYYVNSEASAEDVAQETWIAVLRGAERFEGRSSFKTWLFRIVVNRARKTGSVEHRVLSLDPVSPVPRSRFDTGGTWSEPPQPFTELVEGRIDRAAVIGQVHRAIQTLGEPQRAVVTLRDVEGLSTNEVANLLDLTEGNVRVLLHRGRAKIRETLESTVKRGQPWP